MRRILLCTGVLGGGTALVFALAAATALAFPQGTLVNAGFNGNADFRGGGVRLAMPALGGSTFGGAMNLRANGGVVIDSTTVQAIP
jgi:hypothetical protein